MNLYYNSTTIAAIVTLKIDLIEDQNAALVIADPGETKVVIPVPGKVGYIDIQVDGGKELRTKGNTTVTLISVRSR